jgi:CDP-paratose 2-epimerase
MSMMNILVTGSSGLIGSEAVRFFADRDFSVIGIDNNMRADFFGQKGDTTWNKQQLEQYYRNFTHKTIDIRNRDEVSTVFQEHSIDVVIHTAAQPSHDLAASRP